jgi:DNA repair protein RadA/Sms
MAIVAAIASSFLNKAIEDSTVVLGEIGLTGEVRAVGQMENRLSECQKMGFTRCLIPESNHRQVTGLNGLRLVGIKNVEAAIDTLF